MESTNNFAATVTVTSSIFSDSWGYLWQICGGRDEGAAAFGPDGLARPVLVDGSNRLWDFPSHEEDEWDFIRLPKGADIILDDEFPRTIHSLTEEVYFAVYDSREERGRVEFHRLRDGELAHFSAGEVIEKFDNRYEAEEYLKKYYS